MDHAIHIIQLSACCAQPERVLRAERLPMIRESSHGYWSSNRSFFWVAVGATLSLSQLVRVPYLMAEHGGGAFLLVYVLALMLICVPLVVAEWMLGRWTRLDLVAGFAELSTQVHGGRWWRHLGLLALTGSVLVLSYYSVMAGWSMAYALRMGAVPFSGMSEAQATGVFLSLAGDAERSLSWHTLFMGVVALVVAQGVRAGIERLLLRVMPAAFVMLIGLFLYVVSMPEAARAAHALLLPDLSRLGMDGAVEAVRQAFFTMSLGLGVMIGMGSYLRSDVPLLRLATMVALTNVAVSVVGGMVVLTLVSAAGLQLVPGLALVFQVLPRSLPPGFAGVLIGVTFFLVCFIFTLGSAVLLLEPLTRHLIERLRLTRVVAAISAAIGVWFLGIGTLLSFSVLRDLALGGLNFYGWLQYLTVDLLAPMVGLLLCVLVAGFVPKQTLDDAWGTATDWRYRLWRLVLRYPARIGLLAMLLQMLGIIDWAIQFWSL